MEWETDSVMAQLDAVVKSTRKDFIITFSIDVDLVNPIVSALDHSVVRFTLHDGTTQEGMIKVVMEEAFVYCPADDEFKGGFSDEFKTLFFDDIKEVMYL